MAGILYSVRENEHDSEACAVAEEALAFHRSSAKQHAVVGKIVNQTLTQLLQFDPRLRFLPSGKKCKGTATGDRPHIARPRVDEGDLPKDVPISFASSMGLGSG